MSGKVHPLKGSQRDAVDPKETVWLSASAGTGKTQVLSARVLRLLLQPDVEPSQILCLTFTKAGAAEMAVRVNEVLARWVRMEDGALGADLNAIGAPVDVATRERARTLFASVLDCPGGGLRIDTIHAFAQWLLSAFPQEAGLTPGTRAMEDRERGILARRVLTDMLLAAEADGDRETLDEIEDLSRRKGPEAVEAWLMSCASAHEAWVGPGAWMPPLRPRVNGLLGLPLDATMADAALLCADDAFDVASLRQCLETLGAWDTSTGRDGAAAIRAWLGLEAAERLKALGSFFGTVLNKDGTPKQLANILKRDPGYEEYIARVQESILQVRQMQTLLALAEWLTPALTVGRKFALLWDEAKAREGLIDFDDQIRRASDLLTAPGLSEWIRYKLDRRFDHILVDEAQDTNEAQWNIVDALTEDFFAGLGQRDEKVRTLFVVGDYKQAIFRFQGTSPENFAKARERVRAKMAVVAANVDFRDNVPARPLRDLGLGQSFRTGQPVLTFVDAAMAAVGPERFGLQEAPEPHVGADRPGIVTLWNPVTADEAGAGEDDEVEQSWLSSADRKLANGIASQVKAWLTQGFPLVKDTPRNAGPGDVMVLVRKRKELAGLIVARLYAAGVPVAGVDRLRIGAPLAVKDLMAALRFAAQPLDDLNLANLLVSPLVGWSQDDLLHHGWREEARPPRLWEHLRASADPFVRSTLGRLGEVLARADYEPPQALLHWLLVGPWQGRKALVARLGKEANDPIDELLNAAFAYSSAHTPSLQGFIQWFDTGDGDLKREAGASAGLVRVMTVHGSKGLQAPIVILADATGNPDRSPVRGLELVEEPVGGGQGRVLPLPALSKDDKVGRIAEAEQRTLAEEREEHWRLLYVAMTRAEEALFIGGALGPKDKGEPAADSWYAQLSPLFPEDGVEDRIWGERREIGAMPAEIEPVAVQAPELVKVDVPEWTGRPAGPEPRPPRPLAPSSAGEELSPQPPLPSGAAMEAARRGTLIHALLERLPEIAPEARADAARMWLERQAPDISTNAREEMVGSTLRVLETPEWAELFSPAALPEVPLAATVGGQVIAGTADRLLVTPSRVLVVDFKTAARPPETSDQIPLATWRQMAAYVSALEVIYPGRRVEAAVLYTHAPRLFALPEAALAPHKAALSPAE